MRSEKFLPRKVCQGRVLDEATQSITANRENWINLMIEGEYGLGSVDPHPLKAAVATFAAFLVAGIVPLLAFPSVC